MRAKILESLDYDIVTMVDYKELSPAAEWVEVISPSGVKGYG